MAEDWSREEVAAIVADYFAMLGHELRGESLAMTGEHALRGYKVPKKHGIHIAL